MKKISLLTIAAFLAFKLEAKKIPGKIIFANDTIDVIFNIRTSLLTDEPKYSNLQFKVKFFDSNGKKKILKPNEAKEIRFTYQGENIRMVSKRNTLELGSIFNLGAYVFLRLKIDGYLKLFYFYDTQSSSGMYNANTGTMSGGYSYTVTCSALQKGEGELKVPPSLTFKKEMSQYFSECPKLVEKIQSKDYRKNDLESIVRFYNSNCR